MCMHLPLMSKQISLDLLSCACGTLSKRDNFSLNVHCIIIPVKSQRVCAPMHMCPTSSTQTVGVEQYSQDLILRSLISIYCLCSWGAEEGRARRLFQSKVLTEMLWIAFRKKLSPLTVQISVISFTSLVIPHVNGFWNHMFLLLGDCSILDFENSRCKFSIRVANAQRAYVNQHLWITPPCFSFYQHAVLSSKPIDCTGQSSLLTIPADGGLSNSCPQQSSHFFPPDR